MSGRTPPDAAAAAAAGHAAAEPTPRPRRANHRRPAETAVAATSSCSSGRSVISSPTTAETTSNSYPAVPPGQKDLSPTAATPPSESPPGKARRRGPTARCRRQCGWRRHCRLWFLCASLCGCVAATALLLLTNPSDDVSVSHAIRSLTADALRSLASALEPQGSAGALKSSRSPSGAIHGGAPTRLLLPRRWQTTTTDGFFFKAGRGNSPGATDLGNSNSRQEPPDVFADDRPTDSDGVLPPSLSDDSSGSGGVPLLDSRLKALEPQITAMVSDGYAAERLRQHNADFPRGIHKVLGDVQEGVHVAVGYGLANVVLIATRAEGLIVIDALESARRMEVLLRDWAAIGGTSTVAAVFYSHFHTDHVFGAAALVGEATQVWSHEVTATEIGKVFSVVAGATYWRSMLQFGTLLEDGEFINAGIGPRLHYTSQAEDLNAVVVPTHTWGGEEMQLEIGGVQMVWFTAPGESKDQTACWFPQWKLLFAADNVYKAFPNIYAIRGTESRDPLVWVQTLDKLRRFPAELLVLGHTMFVEGRDQIAAILTVYRDAIQFIHDQTIRRMNKQMPLDEIVASLQLPRHMAEHPWLEPYYGTVEWTVRAVFNHYLGWFSGDAEDLNPLPKAQRALRLAVLAGGIDQLLEAAIDALESHDWQWALLLSSDLLRLDEELRGARRVRVLALKALAAQYVSAPGRNWLLTEAKREEEILAGGPFSVKEGLAVTLAQRALCIQSLKSPADSLDFMPARLYAEKAINMEASVEFRFTDRGEKRCVHIRRGVAYTAPECEKQPPSLVAETTDETWRKIISKQLSPVVAVSTGRFRLVPQDPLGYIRLKYIMSLVDFEDDNGLQEN